MILTESSLVLSDVQRRVIDHDEGHLRIVACPGSGKTEIISRRATRMIRDGVYPSTIVAFTFTVKAAEELKLRIRKHLDEQCPEKSDLGDMYIGTIDSFCLYILKQLKPEYRSFEVLDSAKRIAFVNRWYYEMEFQTMQENQGKWQVIKKFCSSSDIVMTEKIDVSKISNSQFVKCYNEYMKKLNEKRFFDFVTVIHTLLEILKNDPESLKRLKEMIKHVIFDEYQDVNRLQEDLLEYLSCGSNSVCVVGDDDQNIFQWRGSNVNHIIDFPEKYKKYGVTTEKLNINYRATNALVDTASKMINNNNKRVAKNMNSYSAQNRIFEQGDIMHRHFDTEQQEFKFIRDRINDLLNTDFVDKHGNKFAISCHDIAIIVKTNKDAAKITSYLEKQNILCITDSGANIFERQIVSLAADCIFYVFGCEGYSTKEVPVLSDLIETYKFVVKGNVKKFKKNLEEVKNRASIIIGKDHKDWLPNLGLQEFYHRILNAMGAEDEVFDDVSMYNLAVLSKAISDYEYIYQTLRARQVAGLKWFITQYADANYSDPRHADPALVDAVRVLTIWKSKGLEFPAVFIPSFDKRHKWNPNKNFIDDHLYEKTRYDGNVEDDRRAYYTAITRSQKYLIITGAKEKTDVNGVKQKNKQPHPFLDEIKNKWFSSTKILKKSKSTNKYHIPIKGSFSTSYSKLSIYDRCPYDYKLRYVMGFNAGTNMALGYGINIHNILNMIHSNYIQRKTIPTREQIDDIFDKMFHLRFAPGTQNEKLKKAGSNVVKNYVDLHKKDFDRILGTEKRFEFVMGDAMVSGDIDLIKKTNEKGEITSIEIIDFKTDRQNDDGKYEKDHSEQIRFYSYATKRALGYLPEQALIHHLDTNEKEYVDIGNNEIESTRVGIEDRINKIITGKFLPTPENAKCKGCDFRSICSHKTFNVGVNFKPVQSAKKKNPALNIEDNLSDFEIDSQIGKSIISESMMKKADRIAKKKMIKNVNGSYIIPSDSDPKKSYTVTKTRCQCKGFKTYTSRNPGTRPTCSHIIAIKIVEKLNEI